MDGGDPSIRVIIHYVHIIRKPDLKFSSGDLMRNVGDQSGGLTAASNNCPNTVLNTLPGSVADYPMESTVFFFLLE